MIDNFNTDEPDEENYNDKPETATAEIIPVVNIIASTGFEEEVNFDDAEEEAHQIAMDKAYDLAERLEEELDSIPWATFEIHADEEETRYNTTVDK